jgi:hypothetical protein
MQNYIIKSIEKDVSFLKNNSLMDYSMLLGIFRKDRQSDNNMIPISFGRNKNGDNS